MQCSGIFVVLGNLYQIAKYLSDAPKIITILLLTGFTAVSSLKNYTYSTPFS